MRRHCRPRVSTCTLAALLVTFSARLLGTVDIASAQAVPSGRVSKGLAVLYDFQSLQGNTVPDRSGSAEPVDLKIADPKAVRHSSDGLQIVGKTLIRSQRPPARLMQQIQKSGEITIEAWIRPADLKQKGPARVVSLSRDTSNRNFTLGQDGDKLEVRLRTTKTSVNGIPAVATKAKSLRAKMTHVVYTRGRNGVARVYLDGREAAKQTLAGDFSRWDKNYQLTLANELSGDRPWQGVYRLVAIYSRELSAAEVQQNFRAGPVAAPPSPEELVARQQQAGAQHFETRVAPLLAQHCLECHNSATKKGKLDLSRRESALRGGESGAAIVPGKAAKSLLWQMVQSGEMPQKRPPLTAAEKEVLRKWLDEGAAWSLEFVDAAVYVNDGGPQKPFVQRLTVDEYIHSVRDALGVDIAEQALQILPRDVRADGFSNTAYNQSVDLDHVEAYARMAEIVAEKVDMKRLASRYTKSRELTDENVRKVVSPLGMRLLRGPLSKEEIAVYCGVTTSVAAAGGRFEEALRYTLQTMLQSPRFIYRIEQQQGDGSPRPADPYELASRLSFILWGSGPDDELLTAAEKGKLDRAGVEAQAQRMLADRRAVDRSLQFISEWLNLGRLRNLRPDRKKFPQWDSSLAEDMRQETLRFFEEVVWKQNRPLSDLLRAKVTFVTPRLARHYRLPAPKAGNGADAAARYDLSKIPSRGGLLTQGSVLTVGGDEASMVTRGLFVLHELLRGVVRNPPPCVDTTPVPSQPGLSRRAVAEMRVANANCAACHARFEPLAFGLEKFDGLGTFHEKDEHGNVLREDGQVVIPGEDKPREYKSIAQLMDLLAESERVKESFTWKLTQFALGRPLGAADAATVAEIHRRGQEAGGTYAGIMTAIVTSDLVLLTRTEPDREK